ncbi:hypothetical protein ACHAWO_000804 [Cyclotella atomus]|uniref:Uncharacterized protein n=1 Tax=Cyclotella atomus TaxID=382360 RepID=A0ABD3P327_9STRA
MDVPVFHPSPIRYLCSQWEPPQFRKAELHHPTQKVLLLIRTAFSACALLQQSRRCLSPAAIGNSDPISCTRETI